MAVTRADRIYQLTAANDEITGSITVDQVRWVAPAAVAGNQLELTQSSSGDTAGGVWDTRANGANYVEESLHGTFLPHGLRVNVIDSGTLWVYVKGK